MPTPKEDLTSIHQILHLTHHRNKNQHRLSKWYKPFSQLRRQVAKLIAELEALEVAEKFSTGSGKGQGRKIEVGGNVERAGESKYAKAARGKVELRVRFLGEWLVGGCFLAFSNLVADNQYSALGLMLLGALARVKSILGRLMVEQGIHVGLLETAETIEDEGQPAQEEVAIADAGCDDFGELVDREEIIGDIEGDREDLNEEGDGEVAEEVINQAATEKKARLKKRIGPSTDMDEGLAKGESRPSKPPKKKRKKGDAFDDLFDILI